MSLHSSCLALSWLLALLIGRICKSTPEDPSLTPPCSSSPAVNWPGFCLLPLRNPCLSLPDVQRLVNCCFTSVVFFSVVSSPLWIWSPLLSLGWKWTSPVPVYLEPWDWGWGRRWDEHDMLCFKAITCGDEVTFCISPRTALAVWNISGTVFWFYGSIWGGGEKEGEDLQL